MVSANGQHREARTFTCRMCGVEWKQMASDIGRPKVFCSPICKQQWRTNNATERYRQVAVPRMCIVCGLAVPHGGRKLCEPCSDKKRRGELLRICGACGVEFKSSTTTASQCLECAVKAKRERTIRVQRELVKRSLQSGKAVHSSHRVGTQGEMLFDLMCVRNEITAARSIIEAQPNWDRVIVIDSRAVRVSIKSLRSERFHGKRKWRWRKREHVVLDSHIDVLALVDVTTANVVIVPWRIASQAYSVEVGQWEHATVNAVMDVNTERLKAAFLCQ